ncbi:MAG: ATP-binding domain-containing protein [Candidatus Peribacter sp.]|nr:ATP-binding domain-containing protein [Candidatus Peribacter sp.]MBT7679228.1 ATP-binding domain-containing protein [Gammaproteobacteria bacterium]
MPALGTKSLPKQSKTTQSQHCNPSKNQPYRESTPETEERNLIYVAITRARKWVFILIYGIESEFFANT